MGTPGDKAKIGKVVTNPVDPDDVNLPVTTSASTTTTASLQSLPPLGSSQPPTAAATATMGVISRLPQFETFAALDVNPSLSQTLPKPENVHAGTLGLEQGQIDYYFSHSKYYPSVSENVQTVYPILPQKLSKAFPTVTDIEEAGPSGIQTAKTKTTTTLSKVKKGKKPSMPSAPKKTYSCNYCQKNYATAEKLTKHQQTHTGSSPFKCEHCKKVFTSKFKLVRHSLIHSDRKPFICTVCERTFHRKDHLKNHFKVHSPSKEIFTCKKSNCKKQYTSLMSFRKHLAIHEAEEGNLQCQICQLTFNSKEEILYHLKVHAGSRTVKNPNEKKYNCDQCDRKFFTKKDVRRHLVVHTGMRDFLCQFCPQRFGRKDHLVRHIKKSHNKKYQEEIHTAIKTEPKPETITSPEKLQELVDVKTEYSESSSMSEGFSGSLNLFENVNILSNIEENLFLQPSTSSQSDFKDLGNILDEIEDTTPESDMLLVEYPPTELNESEIARLLHQPEENINKPLPPFDKTFQPPPT